PAGAETGDASTSSEPAAVAADAPDAAEAATATAEKKDDSQAESGDEKIFMDIWRPARQGGHRRKPKGRRNADEQQAASAANGAGAGKASRKARKGKPAHKKGGSPGQRQGSEKGDRKPVPLTASPPKPKNKGVDPDSPFAALGKLKQDLQKNTTDQAS
ncbi:MAG: hypothetical protein ACR2O4_02085, partial [Hyphomicrobiaceae bacterium]